MALQVSIESTLDTGVTADITIFQDLGGDGVFENSDTVTATGGSETFSLTGLDSDADLSGTYQSQVEFSSSTAEGGEITSITIEQEPTTVVTWDSREDIIEPQSRLAIPTSGVGARNLDQIAHKYELGTVDDSLVLYYPFDSGTATDVALNNDGTINGPTSIGSGVVGTDALTFDGTDDFIDIPHENAIKRSLGFNYTVACWVRTTSGARQTFINKKTSGSVTAFDLAVQGFNGANGEFVFELENGGGSFDGVSSNTRIDDGAWHHVAGTRLGESGKVCVYVDGILRNSDILDAGSTARNSGICIIGARLTDALSRTDYFGGDLDDIRFYDRALSGPEIRELVYQQSPDNLVLYYPFDTGSGTVADDSSVFDNDGAITDATYNGSGQVGSDSLSFDGSGDSVVATSYKGILGSQPRTTAFWMNTSVSNNLNIIGWGNNSTGQKYLIKVDGDNSDALRVEVNGGFETGTTTLTTGNWIHCAIVFPEDGTDVTDHRLYVNGSLESTGASSTQTVNTASNIDLTIGTAVFGGTGNVDYDGILDDVRLYNRELSESEISDLASRTTTETIPALESSNLTDRNNLESGLVGHWPLDEEAGDAIDHSSNENNASTIGTTTQSYAGVGGSTSYSFNATDSGVQIPNDAAYNIDDGDYLTVCAWVKSTDLTDTQRIISTQDGTYNWWIRTRDRFGNSGADINAYMTSSGGTNVQSGDARSSIGDGAWHHVTAIFDNNTNNLRIFEDGVELPVDKEQNGSVGDVTQTSDLYVGQEPSSSGGNGNNQVWDGAIQDVRIYSRELTQSEIKTIMSYARSDDKLILDSSLITKSGVARYSFDDADTDSGTLSDTFGTNDGTLNGSPTTGVDGVEPISEAYTFDGTDDVISITGIDLDSSDGGISTSVWVKPNFDTVNDGAEYSIIRGDAGGNNNFTIEYIGNGVWRYEWSSSLIDFNIPKNYQNEWLHIVVTEDGSQNAKAYFNGVKVVDSSFGSFQTVTGTIPVDIGIRDGSSYWDGEIDELRIYDRKLEPYEVRELYASPTRAARVGVDDVSDGLVSRWSMNDADVSSNTMLDSVGDNNAGFQGTIETGYTGVGYGDSLLFNGSDSYLNTNSTTLLQVPFTISAWVNYNGGDNNCIIGNFDNTGQDYALLLQDSGQVDSNADSISDVSTQPNTVNAGSWHYVAITIDSEEHRVYVDGTLAASGSGGTGGLNSGDTYKIGDNSNLSALFDGYMSEVRVYNRAIPQYEIWKLYNLGRGYYWSEQ